MNKQEILDYINKSLDLYYKYVNMPEHINEQKYVDETDYVFGKIHTLSSLKHKIENGYFDL